MTSETHLRQMRLFAENHELYINMYSRDFEKDFLDILKRKYFSKKIFANKVYTEMIANKDHTHMSSTKWTTLTGFIQVNNINILYFNIIFYIFLFLKN